MVYAINIKDSFEPAKYSTIGSFLNILFPIMTLGGAIIFLVMLLYGAYTYITAGDNPKNVQKAQQTLVFAFIGLLIVVLSFTAVKLISSLFKVDLTF